ncbi:MAG: flagellar basal-body rod protein FlgF, partial [Pseudomonadales bacterium]|nr:flagellar basal-body rod protein FlgF [Pseudomonadales bacterium]
MDKLLYVAMTGAREALTSQTNHGNNLANVSTTGFKADFNQFRSMSVYGETHPSRAYAMSERPGTDMSAGAFITTARDLDVAINGEGWLAVQMPNGEEAYTRAGDLKRNVDGTLTTGSGLPVMGNGGPIVLPEYETLEIGVDGTISLKPVGETPVGLLQIDRLKLVNPGNENLVKKEDGLFHLRDGGEADFDANVKISHGVLEGSNVNAVGELTEVIAASRLFELNVKMMKTAKDND